MRTRRQLRRIERLFAIVVATLLGGCGTWYAGLQPSSVETSEAYAEALSDHTLRAWRSRGFDHLVSVTATVQTEAFVRARAAEQTRLFSAPVTGMPGIRTDRHSGGEPKVSVVVFVEALQPAWERLDRDEPVWRIYLEVEGVRHEPAGIEQLDVRDAMVTHLFPYVTRFGRPYLLTFPLRDPGAKPVLVMTGPPAQLRLEFSLP